MANNEQFLKRLKEKMTKGLAEMLDIEESKVTNEQLNNQAKKGWCPISKNKLFCTNCAVVIPSEEGKPRLKDCLECFAKFSD